MLTLLTHPATPLPLHHHHHHKLIRGGGGNGVSKGRFPSANFRIFVKKWVGLVEFLRQNRIETTKAENFSVFLFD